MNHSTEALIVSAAQRNYRLRERLEQMSDAHAKLMEHNKHTDQIKNEILQLTIDIKRLEKKKEAGLKTHASYRDSKFKRFGYKITGNGKKFSDRATKEEQDYHKVLSELKDANDNLLEANHRHETALQVEVALQETASVFDDINAQLDELLNSIFSGPTPGYDEEDEIETQYSVATRKFQNLQLADWNETQTFNALLNGYLALSGAESSMKDALRSSTMEMLGKRRGDYLERSALMNAQVLSTQAVTHLSTAKQHCPDVEVPHAFQTPSGSVMTDVFFDNIIFDAMFHNKIKKSKRELEQIIAKVQLEQEKSQRRMDNIRRQVTTAKADVDRLSNDLFNVRQSIIERIAPPNVPKQ